MDVGQGLAVVVQTAEVLLIYDTGAGEPDGANMASSVLLPWLQQLGHRKLTVLIVSHGDRDHASGAATLNARLQITETWYGDKPLPGLSHQVACRAGTTRNFQGLALQVLHPASVQEESSSNNRSCVVRLEYQGFSLLLPGDIEASVERQLAAAWGPGLRSDVLLVPHHGSKTSSSAPFLRAVNPQLAIYSYGYRNHFGHPHVTVVQRYRHLQIPTMATTSSGAIFLRAEHGVLTSAQGWREVDRYYWNR